MYSSTEGSLCQPAALLVRNLHIKVPAFPTSTFFHLKSYFFGELKPHAKFHNPRTTLSGRKVCVGGGGGG